MTIQADTSITTSGETIIDGKPMEQAKAPAQGEVKTPEAKVAEAKVEDEEQSKKDQEAKPKRDRYNERITELTRQRYSAVNEAESWREIVSQVTGEPAPIRTDFATPEEYQDALSDYRAKIRIPEAMLHKAEKAVQTLDSDYEAHLADTWDEKIDKSGIKDFSTIVSQSNLPLTRDLKVAIMASDVGPQLVMHLIDNPSEARAIVRMSPFQQGQVLKELEAQFVGASVANQKPGPNPPPSKQVRGGTNGAAKDPGSMSLEEYSAWRNSSKK